MSTLALADERLPLYQRLRDVFVERIASGAWRPGAPLPAEDDLAVEFGVAVGTVRKAMESLVAHGRLERRQGRGTFVRRADFSNALARFFRMVDESGRPLTPDSRILERRESTADPEAATRLRLSAGAPTIELFRIRLVEGRAILAEEITLPRDPFAGLLALPTEQFGDLLYPLYESACGLLIDRAEEIIRFGAAPARAARALDIAAGAPVAVIDRTAFGMNGAPLEFRRSIGPAERFSYTVDIR
jgi:GntR family transcriptional regulator